MRFRQVHLDFHTSELIPKIGANFDKHQFQQMLQLGKVDSITVFSKCHHGWAYHPSEANETHPHLTFDLLGEMIEAAHEINVKTPVYLSAGLDEKLARRMPQWVIRDKNERTNWAPDFMTPGYHQLCMNTPYLDILVKQIEEVVTKYDVDGIFLDIVGVRACYCQTCIKTALAEGRDPRDEQAMLEMWERTYIRYTDKTNEAVHKHKPHVPVFHNGGHIRRGRRDLANKNSHLELESLPTGGWGYDHFPLSARYAQTLNMKFLGMTGKFHNTWGEFGGYKHPNALIYETALSLANGARCSIGDQLHPEGKMDEATYALIGKAYSEVEKKEPWCNDVSSVADIALLSVESVGDRLHSLNEERTPHSDTGAVRILLEGNLLFDVIDTEADLTPYRLVILPDVIELDSSLLQKLQAFTKSGGKILATGKSCINNNNGEFYFDLGAHWIATSPNCPAYIRPTFSVAGLPETSFVMYSEGELIQQLPNGRTLAYRQDSYFNRDIFSFCSHQHAPSTLKNAGPAITQGADGIYIAWHIFEEYATKASLVLKETVLYAIEQLLPEKTITVGLPAQGIVTVQDQACENRWIIHLLYASPVRRGDDIEVIEDIISLYEIPLEIRVPKKVQQVYLAPSMQQLDFEETNHGTIRITVPEVWAHQMVVLQFD